MAKAAWGIDIGKSALKAVLLKEARGGAEIAACEVIPIRSEEEGVADRENLVKEAFQEFTKKFKVKKEKLVVSLPGNVVQNRRGLSRCSERLAIRDFDLTSAASPEARQRPYQK